MDHKYIESDKFFSLDKVDGLHVGLPTGCYTVEYDGNLDKVFFVGFEPNCDSIVDLPSKEYEYIVGQMENFLRPSTKDKFKDWGFLYKRSALLHGKPGTGKTVIVNRIMKEALKNDAIVLFNPDPRMLHRYYRDINTLDPTKMVLVVFEEFDGILERSKQHEESFLSILDGEIQKDNVMYLATTNYIEKIPSRLKRPGRFGSLVEVGFPTVEARTKYLEVKKVPRVEISAWVEKTDGFSIDELKETVLSVKCLDYKLDDVIEKIKELKTDTEYQDNRSVDGDYDLDDESRYMISSMVRSAAKQAGLTYPATKTNKW